MSRRIAVDEYAQFAAEGYLLLRQGARPTVSEATALAEASDGSLAPARRARYGFRPSVPDVSTFPRTAWLRSLREAVTSITDFDLGYGDPRGVEGLRIALADYLGCVRGVVADPGRIVVTSGYSQGLGIVCHALAAAGATRIGVDEDGIRVEELDRAQPDAVIVTPAHQHPTGAVLTAERRAALVAWLRDRDAIAIAIENDYDAEFRYDRAAIGALQRLEPDRIAYAGSTAKTLAPALRIGWLVVPPRLLEAVTAEKVIADRGMAASTRPHSPTSSRAASSTGTCAGWASGTANGVRRSSRRSRTASRRPACAASQPAFTQPCSCLRATTSRRSSRRLADAAST